MKILSSLVLALAGLAALPGAPAAQNAPVPRINSIPARKSWAPGNLVVLGSNLGLVFGVELDDAALPIIKRTGFRLVSGPLAPRAPGMGEVELISGDAVATGVVEFVPNLVATQRGLRLSLRLNNGEPGTYVVRYSYSAPVAVSDPGIFNPRYLPVNANVIATGIFLDENPVNVPNLSVPFQIGLIGIPLRLQATCFGSDSGSAVFSRT